MKITDAVEMRKKMDEMIEALTKIKKVHKLEDLKAKEIYLDSQGYPLLYAGKNFFGGKKAEHEFIERKRNISDSSLTRDYILHFVTDEEISFILGGKLDTSISMDLPDKEILRKIVTVRAPDYSNGNDFPGDHEYHEIDMIASEVEL